MTFYYNSAELDSTTSALTNLPKIYTEENDNDYVLYLTQTIPKFEYIIINVTEM